MYTTCVHIFKYLYTIYTYKIRILKWFTREISIIRYQPHPLSRSPFHAFNVVLVSCGHFRSHFGQNVISSLSMPMVSNIPYSFLVMVFTPEVIGRRGFWRGARKDHNIILVRSYNKTMDGLVIKKKLYFHSEKKKLYFHSDRKKKLYSGVKTRTPPWLWNGRPLKSVSRNIQISPYMTGTFQYYRAIYLADNAI